MSADDIKNGIKKEEILILEIWHIRMVYTLYDYDTTDSKQSTLAEHQNNTGSTFWDGRMRDIFLGGWVVSQQKRHIETMLV